METQLGKDKKKKKNKTQPYNIFHLFTESSLGWCLLKQIVLQLAGIKMEHRFCNNARLFLNI